MPSRRISLISTVRLRWVPAGYGLGTGEGPGVGEGFTAQAGEAIQLAPAVEEIAFPKVPEKHGHVLIRILSGFAARVGAILHDAAWCVRCTAHRERRASAPGSGRRGGP